MEHVPVVAIGLARYLVVRIEYVGQGATKVSTENLGRSAVSAA